MNTEIGILLLILSATIFSLIFEFLRIDLIAIICMLVLGWSGILSPNEMLSGFSSNAVIVVMAVMIIGRGLEKTGIMDRFSNYVLEKVQSDKSKIIFWISLAVGLLSGFIQNIGAIALFLPGIINISRKSKLSPFELIMPIGFSAILGGTLTLVASGPLVLVNDLLKNAELDPFGIFSVTPVGFLLLFSGLIYFLTFGNRTLSIEKDIDSKKTNQDKLIENLNLSSNVQHFLIEKNSKLIDKTIEDSILNQKPAVNILAIKREGSFEYSPWRKTVFKAGQEIAILGSDQNILAIKEMYGLKRINQDDEFDSLLDSNESGFAEVIIPGRSEITGKTIRDCLIRKRFGIEPILFFSQGKEIRGDFSDRKISPGDSIVVYGLWSKIRDLRESLDFVVASSLQVDEKDTSSILKALLCFCLAIILALLGFPVALSFLSGAIGMVITRIISIEEMYRSIEWKVVFLLAGLIPLGIAMEKTGAAAYIADNLIGLMADNNLLLIISVGLLATLFTLVMSNTGAIVVLAPIIIEMGYIGNFDPRMMVLFAAVCTANSFVLPTHQVNAFIQSPGGYRNADFLKTGIWMTLIFLVVSISYFYILMV
jgi:di/tricarboxylate transporter